MPKRTSNESRAERADIALSEYCRLPGMELYEEGGDSVISDLVSDLLHLAKRDGYDPETVIRVAQMNFEAEEAGE